MSEQNILMRMTMEKNRLIKEMITRFLGHEPSGAEKKQFNIMHTLGECNIYFKGDLIGHVAFDTEDEKGEYPD